MSQDVNKVSLFGRVGNDPDIKSIGDGKRVANFSLATTRTWANPGGERQEKTEWHRLAVFGKSVDTIERFVRKGFRFYVVDGRIEYKENPAPEGGKKGPPWTTIIVNEFKLIDFPADGDARAARPASASNGAPRPQPAAPQPVRSAAPAATAPSAPTPAAVAESAIPDEADDLPF